MSAGSFGVRPTKKVLDDLGCQVPTIDKSLSSIDVDPLRSAQSFPDRYEANSLRRIVSLKDRVWFKLKTARWRGAVVRLTDAELSCQADPNDDEPCMTDQHRWWVGAVGSREDGSRTDFYSQLEAETSCTASPTKKDGVNTDQLLPRAWDRRRLKAEISYAEVHAYEQIMLEAAARSLRSGKIVTASFAHFSMGVVIRADSGQQFVAFIAQNVFDPKRLAVMMSALPGVAPDDWAPEPGGIADLNPRSGEIIWSAVLTTDAADQILERVPWSDD